MEEVVYVQKELNFGLVVDKHVKDIHIQPDGYESNQISSSRN